MSRLFLDRVDTSENIRQLRGRPDLLGSACCQQTSRLVCLVSARCRWNHAAVSLIDDQVLP